MTYNEVIKQVAAQLGLTQKIVDRTYKAYWKAVREHMASLPLKEDLSDEEFMKLQPNVNIPSIGKLHVTLDRYRRMKTAYNAKLAEDKKLKDNSNDTH